jgi:hypothetical protein
MSGTTHNALRTFLHDVRCGQQPGDHECGGPAHWAQWSGAWHHDRCRVVVVGEHGVAEDPAGRPVGGQAPGAGHGMDLAERTPVPGQRVGDVARLGDRGRGGGRSGDTHVLTPDLTHTESESSIAVMVTPMCP